MRGQTLKAVGKHEDPDGGAGGDALSMLVRWFSTVLAQELRLGQKWNELHTAATKSCLMRW